MHVWPMEDEDSTRVALSIFVRADHRDSYIGIKFYVFSEGVEQRTPKCVARSMNM